MESVLRKLCDASFAMLCYAIFAMQSLLCFATQALLCNRSYALLRNLCYAIFAMQSLLCNLCYAICAMQSLRCVFCDWPVNGHWPKCHVAMHVWSCAHSYMTRQSAMHAWYCAHSSCFWLRGYLGLPPTTGNQKIRPTYYKASKNPYVQALFGEYEIIIWVKTTLMSQPTCNNVQQYTKPHGAVLGTCDQMEDEAWPRRPKLSTWKPCKGAIDTHT
jgi:hypothetical protein